MGLPARSELPVGGGGVRHRSGSEVLSKSRQYRTSLPEDNACLAMLAARAVGLCVQAYEM